MASGCKFLGRTGIKNRLQKLNVKVSVSQTAITTLNEHLNQHTNEILKKANEIRTIKDSTKRLSADDIQLAIQKLKER